MTGTDAFGRLEDSGRIVYMMTEKERFKAGYFGNAQSVVPITKEEMEQTQKEMESFSLAGFQVVRREFISHKYEPALTIKGNSIIFNNACIKMLDNVVYIQLLINPEKEQLVIKPCGRGDKDAIRWCIVKEDEARKSRQITCKIFTAKLYDLMGWERLYRYRLQGSITKYKGMELYVFNLSETEGFLPQKKDGSLNRNAPMYPESWKDSFGMLFEEHEESVKVDLEEGFEAAGKDPAEQGGQGKAEEPELALV